MRWRADDLRHRVRDHVAYSGNHYSLVLADYAGKHRRLFMFALDARG